MDCSCRNVFGKGNGSIVLTNTAKEVKYITFAPPKHSLYSLGEINFKEKPVQRKKQEKFTAITTFWKVQFIHRKLIVDPYKWIKTDCYRIRKKNGKTIVVIHIQNTNLKESDFTLLYSQGNSTNLGIVYSTLVDIASVLKVNIVSYDYSGYGESEGKPSDIEICSDIEEVGDFMKTVLSIDFDKVILFCKSIGSLPSLHLASLRPFAYVRALILLSPITSGVKIINQKNILSINDLETASLINMSYKVKDICCSIFVVHGKNDDVIPAKLSEEFFSLHPKTTAWYPKQGDHDNILTDQREKFFSKCTYFLNSLKYYSNKDTSLSPSNHLMVNIVPLRFEENYIKSSPENTQSKAVAIESNTVEDRLSVLIRKKDKVRESSLNSQNRNLNSTSSPRQTSGQIFSPQIGSKKLNDLNLEFSEHNNSDDYDVDARYKEQEQQFNLLQQNDN